MGGYVKFLVRQQNQKTEVAATLTLLGLANLIALLERRAAAVDAGASIALATSLYRLLQRLGRPRLLARVGQVRDAAAKSLEEADPAGGGWSHARFEAQHSRIAQQLASGQLREALTGAQALLEHARAAGPAGLCGHGLRPGHGPIPAGAGANNRAPRGAGRALKTGGSGSPRSNNGVRSGWSPHIRRGSCPVCISSVLCFAKSAP